MSIATTMAIRDQMTQTLNRMERYTRQLNAALRETGVITETANPGGAYDRASASILRAADQVDRFNDQQTQAERQAQAVGSAWSKVGGYVKSAAAAFGASKLVGLSDTIAGNRARLGLIVDDGGSVAELEDKLFASAMRSRAAYTDVAESVSKLGLLAGKAFGSNDEIIAFTELMNKNFALSGADQATRSAAMRQLTQAMGSGRLQGDEYVSITENASLLANAIEDYMRNVQGAKGSMKDWASEGLLTADVIKAAMFNTADEVEKRFEETPMTWAQVGTLAANIAIKALDPLLTAINWLANNIRIIGPLVLGLGGAFAVFQVAAHWTAIAGAVTGAYHFAVNLLSIGFGVLSGSSAAASAAVFTFNSALLASPITWVVMGVLLLVGVLFAAVAAFNKLTGASVSAVGVIGAIFAVLGAHLANTFLIPLWNGFAAVANFFGNVFRDPVGAVKVLFYDMCLRVLGYIRNLAEGIEGLINRIPGMEVDITSGMDRLYSKLEDASAKVKSESEWVEYVKSKDFIDYGDAAKAGYDFGVGIKEKVAGLFGGDDTGINWEGLQQGVADIAANTGAMADEVNIADEDLKFMKDVAEMRYVQNFVTLTPTVSMDARISERVDVNEVVFSIAQVLEEEIAISAEGKYA